MLAECSAIDRTPSGVLLSSPPSKSGVGDGLAVSNPTSKLDKVKSLGSAVWALTDPTVQPQVNKNRLSGKREADGNRRTLVSIAGSSGCH